MDDERETTSERQMGNNWVTSGRHLETIGRPILEDSWELWKTIPGSNLETTSGKHLGDNWQTLRHLGDHMWETAGRAHLGDSWETSSEREREDNYN